MIDFNNASAQKTGGGTIPPKSIVKVLMTVREPGDAKRCEWHPLITVFNSGMLGLDCEFEVIFGTFEGNRIWENLFLSPEMQPAEMELTRGQDGICKGSFAKLRAMIEAYRGIDPNDSSPAATNARNLQDWTDFQGMIFPIMVGVDKPKKGDVYLNNNIIRVITVEREDYKLVMGGGEFISELPLPEIPESEQKTGSGAAKTGYQAPQNQNRLNQTMGNQSNNGYQAQNNQGAQGGAPQWAQK
ncbi:MAG: hypothetical protein GY710_14045 [Desulfobacteraceae bacterium]|nr:hypothetical protein [Desulfobacteraceae bacterium]